MVYMRIIEVTEDDMPRIMEIELEALSPPWTYSGLLSEMNNAKTLFAAAVEEDTILGFIILRHYMTDEGELLQIAVDKMYRRRGVADMLLNASYEWAKERGMRKMYLEVRESNEAANELYNKHGFRQVGRRKDYYINPVEDSLTMLKEL